MPSLNRRRVTTSLTSPSAETHAILNVLIKMKNNGKADVTIKFVRKALTRIQKLADLNNPQQVKQFIANLETANSYKRGLCFAYKQYCDHYKITWERPVYYQEPKAIRIPTTTNINMLIANWVE
jgi:hypothetical protein